MNILSSEQLQRSKETAKDNEIRQNVKSHCTKIKQGILNNGNISGNRAIWELFQNAGDLSQSAEIEMSLDEQYFTFAHKGKPFTYDSLCSLVKQVSSEEKENDDTVGQYGTGFLTTHTFGRKILLQGSMKISEYPQVYVDIDDFVINRENFADIPAFIEDMKEQIKFVERLMDAPQKETPRVWTKLQYILVPDAIEKVRTAFEAAEQIMPFVLTFNDNIGSCTLHYPEKSVIFIKEETQTVQDSLKCTKIYRTIGDEKKVYHCYFLDLHNGESRIILPIDKDKRVIYFGKEIPKLYVHYPLIGQKSNYQNVNFLFHSHRFVPEEPRDNIIVPKDNDAVQHIAHKNIEVLNEMTMYLWNFLDENVEHWTNTIELASINIKTENFDDSKTQAYYVQLKHDWVQKFKSLKLFEIDNEKYNLLNARFPRVLAPELETFISDSIEKDYLDIIYDYALSVGLIPSKSELLKWSKILSTWGGCDDKFFIQLSEIAEVVSKSPGANLHEMLQLIADAQYNHFFKDYALLPNRAGILKKETDLYDADIISKEWYELLNPLIPQECEKMVDESYVDIIKLRKYSGEDLRNALNARVTHEENNHWKVLAEPYSGDFERHLIQLCSVFPLSSRESKRSNIIPIICKFENIDYIPLNNLSQFIHNEAPMDIYTQIFPSLVENQMKKIAIKDAVWVNDNLADLARFVEHARGKDYERFAYNYAIYPNANLRLNKPDELKRNCRIDPKLFDLYEKIIGKDLKEVCVDTHFENFCEKYDEEAYQLSSPKVAVEIQTKLSDGDYKDTNVLDIIDLMETSGDIGKIWQKWFTDIYKQRESIRYRLGTDEERKAINRMMKQKNPQLLQMMADVAEQENAMTLVTEFISALNHEEHIKKLGRYVEKGIESYLIEQLKPLGINVRNQQNGQDFILSKEGKDDYYIEVKSRWSSADSVEMSPAQFNQAATTPDRYALIGVNMLYFDQDKAMGDDILNVNDVINDIHVLDIIGYLEKELHKKTMDVFTRHSEDIHLDGMYKVRIPQIILKGEKSKKITDFLDMIKRYFA